MQVWRGTSCCWENQAPQEMLRACPRARAGMSRHPHQSTFFLPKSWLFYPSTSEFDLNPVREHTAFLPSGFKHHQHDVELEWSHVLRTVPSPPLLQHHVQIQMLFVSPEALKQWMLSQLSTSTVLTTEQCSSHQQPPPHREAFLFYRWRN